MVVALARLFVDKLLDDRLVDKDIDHQTELLKDSHVVCSGRLPISLSNPFLF